MEANLTNMNLPWGSKTVLKRHFALFALISVAGTLCLSFLSLSLCAQTTDSIRANILQEVKVSAKRVSPASTSATPMQMIAGEELQRLNSFSVADALRYFSGIQLKDYGGVGGLKTVNVRSMGSHHTQVFYDGVQMGNAQNGQVDLGRFSLDNMQEVTLYSGQSSNLFQPAKSFSSASSIYLKTIQPSFQPGESARLRASIKAGSFGLINPSLFYEQKLSSSTTLTVSTEYLSSAGDYTFRYTNGVYDTTAARNNSDIHAYRLETALHGSLKDSSSWVIKGYQYHSERGLPGAIVSNKFEYSQRQWDRNLFFQGHFESPAQRSYAFIINAKYAHDYLRYLDPEFITVDGFLNNKFNQQEVYLSMANRLKLMPNWDVNFSADYQWNKLDANLYRFPYPTRHTLLSALASEIRLTNLTLQASLLHTVVLDRVREFTSAGNKKEWSPTVMASLKPFGSEHFLLRAFYKNIFRLPTFNDLYYTFIGNSLLRPEFTDQFDLGVTYSDQASHGALVSLAVQADAYYNRVKDKIVAIPGANLYRWTMYNIGEVAIKGLEVNVQTLWTAFNDIKVRAGLSYTYQQARDVTNQQHYPFNIPYIPLHSGSFTLGADIKRLELNYSYIYSGERYNQLSTIQNAGFNYMEPWYTHDAGLGYQIRLLGRLAKVNVEINNIFGQDREVILNFPMPRRFYRFKLSYTI